MPGKHRIVETFATTGILLILFPRSVWIIVCMSFERYFAVSRPLLASQMCTTKRAKWVRPLFFRSLSVLIRRRGIREESDYTENSEIEKTAVSMVSWSRPNQKEIIRMTNERLYSVVCS